MSQAGIVFVSVLLGFNLVCLLALAIYCAWIPRWTRQLGLVAMLRIEASISERISLYVERIKPLDETPSWISNDSDDQIVSN